MGWFRDSRQDLLGNKCVMLGFSAEVRLTEEASRACVMLTADKLELCTKLVSEATQAGRSEHQRNI